MARAGLTPRTVVDEAARLCDDEGPGRLSLAAVAKRLNVAVPSLYKHVDGLARLQREVGRLGLREMGAAMGKAAMGRSGPDALRAVAHAYRDYARAHPGRYAFVQQAPDPDDAETIALADEVLAVIYAVLRGFGLAEASMVDSTRVLRSVLHGFVDLEARGGFGLPDDIDHSFELLVTGLISVLGSWPRAAAHKEG